MTYDLRLTIYDSVLCFFFVVRREAVLARLYIVVKILLGTSRLSALLAFDGRIGDLGGYYAYCPDRIVVGRDYIVHFVRVAVGINHSDDDHSQLDSLGDGDALAMGVYDEYGAGDFAHGLDAAQEVVQARDLFIKLAGLRLG